MGQMLKNLGEKKQNIIRFVMGRKNKMVKGWSPSTQRFLIAFAHRPGRAPMNKKDDLTPNQKGCQITFARSNSKVAVIFLSRRSRRVAAFYFSESSL